MSLNVISNFAANVAQRHLSIASNDATNSVAKLSAGTRVLTAKDDAAALAIGSRLNAEVQALGQAQVNAGQAVSMLQIADGGMARIDDILVRMKTLAVQAASGQLSADERAMLDEEFQALKEEVDRIADDTTFNDTQLLNADQTLSFKVGTGSTTAGDSNDISVDLVDVGTTALAIDGDSITTVGNANTAIDSIDAAIDTLAETRADLGAAQNRLEFASQAIATTEENTEAARSALMDLDIASEMSNFTSKQILVQAGVAMLGQANQLPQNLLGLFQ